MFRTKIIYIDVDSKLPIEIDKTELINYELKTISKSTKRNGKDYITTIAKIAKRREQTSIKWNA